MFRITARLDVQLDPDDILVRFGLEPGGPVQKLIDQRVIDYCDPYVPASPDQTLKKSTQLATEIGSGYVVWNTPYAHYQYMGIVYGPSFPIFDPDTGVLLGFRSPAGKKKHPTDKKLSYDQSMSPLAGSRWFERMKADHLNDILNEARRLVRNGGKE